MTAGQGHWPGRNKQSCLQAAVLKKGQPDSPVMAVTHDHWRGIQAEKFCGLFYPITGGFLPRKFCLMAFRKFGDGQVIAGRVDL